ncbi:MAG: hypothetical protein ACI4JB_10215 [Porcipelethomonas sp.]
MKKFLIFVIAVIFAAALYNAFYYRLGFFEEPGREDVAAAAAAAEGENIYLISENGKEEFEIRGVQISGSLPGHYPRDGFAGKKTYKNWFGQIHDMGANTLSVCSIMPPAFYSAVYEYNHENAEPLYVIQGISVEDYSQNCREDAYSFYEKFSDDCMDAVDIIYGKKGFSLSTGSAAACGFYNKDISKWVIGLILGTEWNTDTVAYTDHSHEGSSFSGDYLSTSADASPFEVMLADVGDRVISYETGKYGVQHPIAFYNSVLTDPFMYQSEEARLYNKYVQTDTEHIKASGKYRAGLFAAYAVYPESAELAGYEKEPETLLQDGGKLPENTDKNDKYELYLALLNTHHSVPVLVSEFGASAARGSITEGNDGKLSPVTEQKQGQIISDCYKAIEKTGCAGGVICQWQDEWYKQSWNTQACEDSFSALDWNDCQTDSKNYGLLTFDPGDEESICVTDGDISEWSCEDPLSVGKDGTELYMKYDEKYIYLRVSRKNLSEKDERVYIPIDVTPLSGSKYAENCGVKFERETDFLIILDGEENSRMLVQEYYDPFPVVFGEIYDRENPFYDIPDKNSSFFERIYIPLSAEPGIKYPIQDKAFVYKKYETGKLIHGNGDPKSLEYNSSSDFIMMGDETEIRIPWLLLNFSDPSRMKIHDDYYENYGIENLSVDSIYIGVGSSQTEDTVIGMSGVKLDGWYGKVSCHERLREAYYTVQKIWKGKE